MTETQVVSHYPPETLMAHCEEPKLRNKSWLQAVQSLLGALRRCNVDKEKLREWRQQEQRREEGDDDA